MIITIYIKADSKYFLFTQQGESWQILVTLSSQFAPRIPLKHTQWNEVEFEKQLPCYNKFRYTSDKKII